MENSQAGTPAAQPIPRAAFHPILYLDPKYTDQYKSFTALPSNPYDLSGGFYVPKDYFYHNAMKLMENHLNPENVFYKNSFNLYGDKTPTLIEVLRTRISQNIADEIYEDLKYQVGAQYVYNFFRFISPKLVSGVLPASVRQYIDNNVRDRLTKDKNIEKVWQAFELGTFKDMREALLIYNTILANNNDSYTPDVMVLDAARKVGSDKEIYIEMNNAKTNVQKLEIFYDYLQQHTNYESTLNKADINTNNQNLNMIDMTFWSSQGCFAPLVPQVDQKNVSAFTSLQALKEAYNETLVPTNTNSVSRLA